MPLTADAAIVTDTGLAVGAGGSLYTINNDAGWRTFCDMVNSGTSFSGMTVRLGSIIGSQSYPVTAAAGSDYSHLFSGTFDGNGKKLYFEGSAGNPAPFAFLVGTESVPLP